MGAFNILESGRRKKKILLLTRYDRQGASSRLRTMQYIPYFDDAEWELNVHSLFDAEYLASVYHGKRALWSTLKALLRRISVLRNASSYDVVWLEKEALPWLPWFIERLFLPKKPRLVVDYDDAIFHRYDTHSRWWVRFLLGKKIDKVMARSDCVFAGNAYLGERARAAGAPLVKNVPTVVDVSVYQVKLEGNHDGLPTVGWIGTPESWRAIAGPCLPMVGKALAQHGGSFLAVGAGEAAMTLGWPNMTVAEWSEASEVSLIQSMDIGIMPMEDTPWTRGKCGYKLIQYMACGLPVVGSAVGANVDIVEHGVSGFLVKTQEEWTAAIGRLLREPELRLSMGAAGRRKVEQHYSLQQLGPAVASHMGRLASQAGE